MPEFLPRRRYAILTLAFAFLPISLAFGTDLGSLTLANRVRLEDSIKEVPVGAPAFQPHRVREELTAGELSENLDFVVSLRMRNYDELEALIQTGHTVPQAEMEMRYLPARADYDRIAGWLRNEGFQVTIADSNHTNLFVRGTVAQIRTALGVTFARILSGNREFTSAITAPLLPQAIADPVLGIDGLQPHIRMQASEPIPEAVTVVNGRVTPADILAAYSVPSNLNGAGQTIAIIMGATPLSSDLSAFWQAAGINEIPTSYQLINVSGGPTSASQTTSASEVALDTEWSTGIAPGAQLRVYAIPSLSNSSLMAGCTAILNDGLAKVASYSAFGREVDDSAASLKGLSQVFSQMAAAGITMLASSGDSGSNPNPTGTGNKGYNLSNPLSVSYPASDPNVTGVGGTTPTFNANWAVTGETVWSQIGNVATNPLATGGGISSLFARPTWQTGLGVPAGTLRCVPDVAAISSANPTTGATGAYVIVNGQQVGLIGTSLSSPVWAGLVAVINQARANVGLPSLGLLGPWIYPLIGTNAFKDITSGNNGAYSAGIGYDLCTGVGSPNVTNLISGINQLLFTYTAAPVSPVNAGSTVTLSATPQLPGTYQWQLNGVNISGATASSYSIPVAGAADDGVYTVIITNSVGPATYSMGTLSTVSDARIVNLSARADVLPGVNALVAGFVVSGSGQKSVLLRGVGPTLAQYGVPGALGAPVLTLFNSNSVAVATNAAWAGSSTLANTMARVGAFALPANSLDDALLQSFSAGSFTAQVSGANNSTGVALAELYDADTGSPPSRLINISARADVQAGANALVAGFSIAAGVTNADETVLIRGVGPALAGYGVSGSLPSPILTLFDSHGTVIAMNQGWSANSTRGPSTIKAGIENATAGVMAGVSAFPLPVGSSDAAMTVTLPPGTYTAQVSGANSATGVGLVEVYEVR